MNPKLLLRLEVNCDIEDDVTMSTVPELDEVMEVKIEEETLLSISLEVVLVEMVVDLSAEELDDDDDDNFPTQLRMLVIQ